MSEVDLVTSSVYYAGDKNNMHNYPSIKELAIIILVIML